jgi:hypothetical protein
METILMILGILGVGIISIFTWVKKLVFKHNIEFHKILGSFPMISEHRINEGTKTIVNDFTEIQISKELTEFAESKKGDLDEFLARLEKFDESKLRFKKKEITIFIQNIKRLLVSKSTNITLEGTLDIKTNEMNAEINGKSFEWTAFNYYIINKIMNDQKKINELYVCKKLKF